MKLTRTTNVLQCHTRVIYIKCVTHAFCIYISSNVVFILSGIIDAPGPIRMSQAREQLLRKIKCLNKCGKVNYKSLDFLIMKQNSFSKAVTHSGDRLTCSK